MMTSEKFIKGVRQAVYDSSSQIILSVIDRPPRHRPTRAILELSKWYHTLGPAEKDHLRMAIEMSAHNAIFGMLCILDGVRSIWFDQDDAKGRLVLKYVKDHEEVLLTSPEEEMLHDQFVGEAPQLFIEPYE